MQKEHFLKKTVIVCLLAMICCVLWGSAFPGIKIGYKLWNIDIKDMASQIVFAGVRFFLAGVLRKCFAKKYFVSAKRKCESDSLSCRISDSDPISVFLYWAGSYDWCKGFYFDCM